MLNGFLFCRLTKLIIYSLGFYLDTEERHNLLPGFLDSIIGIQQGKTRTFPLQFPETWEQDSLRGSHAQFTVSS